MTVQLKALKSRLSFRFSPTRWDAIIHARLVARAAGLGHNATAKRCGFVVPSVVGLRCCNRWDKCPPTTPQRENHPLSRTYMRARAYARVMCFLRCGVVSLSYPIDIYREKATTPPTTLAFSAVVAVVACVVPSSNSLKNNKKGGFYAEV